MIEDTQHNNEFDKPSKSQRKRDMDGLKKMANRLTELSADQLSQIDNQGVREAIEAAKKITKGNARKRQLQYAAKLLSRIDISPIQKIIDTLDASSSAYVQKFHQLEAWRERLISEDSDVMGEIFSNYPYCDRQQLRHMTRSAINERTRGEQQVHYRKLFQFLKTLNTEPETD